MIAKTVLGKDFEGANEYGAGIRSGRSNKQAELISKSNLGGETAKDIAAEMQVVASLSERIEKPVWHTSLSWAPGEIVSREQKLQAAALYCELIGASLERHQVAVYEHNDKPHVHLHIYINRVPIDGGPALRSDQNYARNVKATQQIRQQLGMTPLPEKRQSLKDHSPEKEATRELVQAAVRAGLQDQQITSVEQLRQVLQQQGITTQLKRNEQGVLVGVSFRAGKTAVTGTEVGYKGQQLRDHFAGEAQPSQRARQTVKPGAQPPRSLHPTSKDAERQGVRTYVSGAISKALQDKTVKSLEQLGDRLRTQGIAVAFKRDTQDVLVGSGFRYQGVEVKGTEVGFKAKQLRDHFEDEPKSGLRASANAGPQQRTAGPSGGGGLPAGFGTQEDSGGVVKMGELLSALSEGMSADKPGSDDAGRNENEIKRRRRRRPRL